MVDPKTLGKNGGWFVVAGPCVIEDAETLLQTAGEIKRIASEVGVPLVFKASFDKANRSSVGSFRGPGLSEGLKALAAVKRELDLPILTDVHEVVQVAPVAEVADVLQIPAFLARQTDLLAAVAKHAKVVNVKKGQFMAPWEMANAVEKVRTGGPAEVWLTERGTSFGYNNLVVDFRGLPEMRKCGCPVLFDGTHSVQQPAAQGRTSGGTREHIPALVRAATAVGIDGLFLEVHPEPEHALSDASTQIDYQTFRQVLLEVRAIREALTRLGDKAQR
jgi:2-dehydro-3-deoxyphosphooctonate aldolase (KDO 8-P synthase)